MGFEVVPFLSARISRVMSLRAVARHHGVG